MKIVYCQDPLNSKEPDPLYIDEVASASRTGLNFELISYEALVDESNPARAVRLVPVHHEPETVIYRGWTLTVEQYTQLYDALLSRGVRLINSPAAYRHCHHLPESLHIIESMTPHTVWSRTDGNVNYEAVMELLKPFGDKAVIVKDFVKSQKHYWYEACFIEKASDRMEVERVVRRFIELQGKSLAGGLVFREYMTLEPLTEHAQSGMPLAKEFRIFFLDGEPISIMRYWNVDEYDDLKPPVQPFLEIAQRVRSRFFTMDIAERANGEWVILELGDGQVAGIPHSADIDAFYRALRV